MRLADIEVGKTYEVLIPEHEDVPAWHNRRYHGEPTYAEIIEVGVHYDVPRYTTSGGLRGANGRGVRSVSRWERSARADGVRVRWSSYGDKTATVPCRSVLWAVTRP